MPPERTIDQDLEDRLKRLNEIGVSLSVERDLHALLERIVLESRGFTHADAGTLYLRDGDELIFEVSQNDTLPALNSGGHGKADVPPVSIDRGSVSGYVAVTGSPLNITDVYVEEGGLQFDGPRLYDQMTGYRTTSMLVVPMKDHEDEITGVVQLINATDPDSGDVVAFTAQDEALVQSLASQAAVAINNVRLIAETEQLFEAVLQVLATAIDERSPYTGGHIRRVAEMTMHVAGAVNACEQGPFATTRFNGDELNELRVAAWMHDIGKITTPEWVVDKPTKLTTIFDRIELVRTRFLLHRKSIEVEMLAQRPEAGEVASPEKMAEYEARLAQVDGDLQLLERVNQPGESMSDEDVQRLERIAQREYVSGNGAPSMGGLTDNELYNLSIRRGTLTNEEYQKIKDHASMTVRMLGQIPFTSKLSRVPEIAGGHHERPDGTGYPQGLASEQIALQTRILALIDVFESLSADDRPYRTNPMSRDMVLGILQKEVDEGHLDGDVLALFLDQKLYLKLDEIKDQEARESGCGAEGDEGDH